MAEKYVEKIKSASSGEIYTIRDANIDTKQDLLVSGTNIKTINNQSILGSGNIDIQGGTGAVESVNNKTGKVTLTASDVGAATEAQGAKADTAVQPAAIADMETQTHASSTYQTKLTSANAGTNVTITEESGVVKISAAGGSGGASTFAELQGQPTDNANLAAALNAKQETLVSGTNIKSINNTSLLGEGNVEVLTSSDVGTMAAEDKTDYFTKTEVTDGFLPNNLGSENIGKYVKVGSDGDVVTETVNIPDVSNYYTKTEVDNEFLPSNLGSENADKFLAVASDGSLKFEDAPEAAQIEARVEVLEDNMDSLIKDDSEEIDITTTATTHETAKYATKTGGTASSTSWEYYALENDDFESINYGLYSGGNMSTFNFIDFYNSTTPSSVSHIGRVAITALNSYITGTVEVPAGTKYITINNKRLNGETVNIPTIIGIKGIKGAVPELQDQMAEVQAELEKLAGKSVKEGLRIAIIGDSISTRESLKTPEITIQPEDVGVQLGAWVTIYDALPLTIGDKTFTESDIGSYVTFTPTAADIGKRVGTEHIYSGNANVKIWWQYLADLGATMINGTYCSASMSSHEKDIQRLCTSWSWHDQQIRRLGRRIPGTMQREAPDIIIMYRGVNDMTHTPYVSLTNNYFDSPTWTYPTDDNLGGTNYGFKEGVSIWVSKLRKVYPRAQIVFATANTCKRISYSHFPTNNGDYSLPTFSKAIREAADFFGCKTIDFDKDGITFENCYPTYISDSATTPTHPNATGHAVMAVQAITDLDSKLDLFNFTPLNLMGKVDHHIITNLTDVTISNTATVYTGDSFEATLEATDGGVVNSVIITMGGIDITSTAYTPATGIISIANVTGDIIVTASSVPPEQVELTQNLSHATSSASTTLPKNQASTVIITADDGYMIDNITVTMGGTDITADSYVYYTNNAEVRIANVTDDVTITATTTYVNSNYQVLKELYGQSSKAIFTDLTGSDLSRCLTKIYVRTVTDSNAFGIFGDIFCNESGTVFSTGSTTGSTEVTVQANTEYLINLVDVDQSTSSLEIYAGNDITLSNRLGIGTRSVAPGSVYFTFLGLQASNAKYACTNQAFQYSYMYDSNNNVIHHYIPVKQLSSNTNGIYDIETGTFATFSNQTSTSFVNVTKTLSNVICSAGNKLISNKPAHIVLTAEDGYTIDSVTVTMDGADITDSSYEYYANNAEINITNVTGDITITASATLVNASYRVMKELYGKPSKAIDTGLAYTAMNRVLYKMKAVAPKDMEGQGFYGYAFANEINDPTLDIIVFAATGSTTTLSQYRITNANAGQKYFVNITDVDTGTATISMYDGDDTEMSTLLGSTQRVHGSVNYNWSWCGMLKSDGRSAYATTNQSLFYGKMYNSGDTLIHNYIPVMNILTGEEGLYDTVADAFKGFVDVTD